MFQPLGPLEVNLHKDLGFLTSCMWAGQLKLDICLQSAGSSCGQATALLVPEGPQECATEGMNICGCKVPFW